jgi:hypothetical protein
MGLRSAPKHPNDEIEGSKVGKARYSYGTLVLWFRYTEGKHFSVLSFYLRVHPLIHMSSVQCMPGVPFNPYPSFLMPQNDKHVAFLHTVR